MNVCLFTPILETQRCWNVYSAKKKKKKKKKPDRDFNILLKSMSLVFGCDVEPFYSWMPEEPCTALGID